MVNALLIGIIIVLLLVIRAERQKVRELRAIVKKASKRFLS
jgi:hypothetical protein